MNVISLCNYRKIQHLDKATQKRVQKEVESFISNAKSLNELLGPVSSNLRKEDHEELIKYCFEAGQKEE